MLAASACLPVASSAQDRESDRQRSSKNGSLEGAVADLQFELHYGRPKTRGRELWGGLVPWGKVWRAGANEATTVHFSRNARILGNDIPAGSYSLFVIPEKERWTFILNKVAEQWGAYLYDSEQDLCRFSVAVETGEFAEELTYSFENGKIYLAWGELRAGFPIESR
jgi:hypothetical protein